MRKVITYGTFDLFHQGHYNILKRAREIGDYLIVGVTGESYDLERGKINVRDSLATRIKNVQKTGLADQIIIEEYLGQKVDDIIKNDIDVFVVGSDWIGKFDYLRNYCEVAYLERTKDISSSFLREQEKILKMGIATDKLEDNGVIYESKYVSGIHIDSVYSQDGDLAERYIKEYEINHCYVDYDVFIENVDIVYISLPIEQRYEYVKKALMASKHVIVDSPITLDVIKLSKLFRIAHDNSVLIIENIVTAYLRAFNQLVWLINGNLIGKIVAIGASMSSEDFECDKSITEMLVYPTIFASKLIQNDLINTFSNLVNLGDDKMIFRTQMDYGSVIFNISISKNIKTKSEFCIYGTEGKIEISDDWWNTGYFEAWIESSINKKRYCFNFEGNGFRYLLQELLIMIRDKRKECTRIFDNDSLELIEKIGKVLK